MLRYGLLISVAFLSACTTPSAVPSGSTLSGDAKLFADFLAGTYASNVSDFDARANYYSRAFARAPEDMFIGRRALSFALLDGQIDLARALATDLLNEDPKEPMARMVLGQRAFTKGNFKRATELFTPDTADITMGIAMDIMDGWNAVEMGERDRAVKIFENLPGGSDFKALGRLQIAILDAEDGKIDQALSRLDDVDETGLYYTDSALTRARILASASRRDEAITVLRDYNEKNGNLLSGPASEMIRKLEAGEIYPISLSSKEQAARALAAPSFSFFVRAGALDAAELYLRMAHDLDPNHDLAKILLGEILDNSERSDGALALYQSIGDKSDYVISGRLAEANVYFDREEDDIALAKLEAINKAKPTFVTREALGRARLIRENYDEALPLYDALVKSLTEEEIKADPTPVYLRGVSHERVGNFEAAVADFRRVLKIQPENAEALNYLGYTWVDRGENLQEAFEMIEKAVELEPTSGAIVDSLGWGHYKLGRYTQARKHLEKAATLSPSSATIIDHLGDVYWKLGRFREAGYQWQRALELDPTDEERAKIRLKLKGGLDAATAAP